MPIATYVPLGNTGIVQATPVAAIGGGGTGTITSYVATWNGNEPAQHTVWIEGTAGTVTATVEVYASNVVSQTLNSNDGTWTYLGTMFVSASSNGALVPAVDGNGRPAMDSLPVQAKYGSYMHKLTATTGTNCLVHSYING